MVNAQITFRTNTATGGAISLGGLCQYVQCTAITNAIWVGPSYVPPGSLVSAPSDPNPTAGSSVSGWYLVQPGTTFTYDVSKGSNTPADSAVNYVFVYCATSGGYLTINAR